jgi:hypothetical protein
VTEGQQPKVIDKMEENMNMWFLPTFDYCTIWEWF